VVFSVDVAAWDQMLFEDETTNRMQEELTLFDSIINARWFKKTRFILLFTKTDKLETKVKKSPIEKYFSGFEGDSECLEDVKAYIKMRFLNLSQHPEMYIEVIYTSFSGGYGIPARSVLDSLARLLSVT
jgi:guanine nucleotide-binding protein G(i) subunit alpha